MDRFIVNTKTLGGEVIDSRIITLRDEVVQNTVKTVIDTRDKQIREALIALGWTPPQTEPISNQGEHHAT